MACLCDANVERLLQRMLSTDLPLERPLAEAKARLPHLHNLKERAEFLRDCIAMGNTVRRMRKRGYLVFGVTQQRTIVDQSQALVYRTSTISGLEDRMGSNENWIVQCLQEYVTPLFDFELHYCRVEGPVTPELRVVSDDLEVIESSHGVVICLEFHPLSVQPYRVKKKIDYEWSTDGELKRGTLQVGSAWTRIGTSKGVELPPGQHDLLVGFQDAPYVDNETWHRYAVAYPESEWLALDLSVSGTLGGLSGDALELALSWVENAKRSPVLFLHGGIGSGKSTLLNRLFSALLSQLAINTDNSDPDDITGAWIPVFVDLNGMYFDDPMMVADHVLSQLNWYGTLSASLDGVGSTRVWKRRLFECGDYRYVALFDGLDELEDSQEHPWQQSVASIRQFMESNGGRICSIIAGRNGAVSPALLKKWSQLELMPLDQSDIEASFESLESPTEMSTLLKRNIELAEILTTPLALQAVWSFAQNVERQNRRQAQKPTAIQLTYDPGELTHEVVTAIFRHESAKDPARNRDETRIRRMNALAQLAWQLDGKTEMATLDSVSTVIGADEIVRAKQMGILVLASNAYYQFTSPLLKAYFAARHAIHLIRTANSSSDHIDWDEALRHATPSARFWVRCESLFTSMLEASERESARAFYRFVQSTTLLNPSNT